VYTRAGGAAEGLILSSVMLAGQRHLCEEQTYLAQQAIHQIAALGQAGCRGGGGGGGDDTHRTKDTGWDASDARGRGRG